MHDFTGAHAEKPPRPILPAKGSSPSALSNSGLVRPGSPPHQAVRTRSVLVLDLEEGTANCSGQPRLLPRELEPRGELRGDFHPFRELEPDRALRGGFDGIHHIDR